MIETAPGVARQAKTARDLCWSAVLEMVSRRCCNAEAARRLGTLRPLPRVEQAAAAQQRVREAMALLRVSAELPAQSVPEIPDVWSALPEGAAASKEQLRDLARVLEQAGRLRSHLSQHAERAGALKTHLWSDPALDALQEQIRWAIDEQGEILDAASKDLRAARRSLDAIRSQLKTQLARLLTRHSAALAGQYFADRDGRYVLPVRIDAQSHVDGLVLGASGSGGTLYVEPRELTELNNRLRVSEATVVQEEFKVLLELSRVAATLLEEIQSAYDICIEADKIAAVALWANEYRAEPMHFGTEPELHLVQFRHPLLLGQAEPVVANDIRIDAAQCLITSGPNAGGKTVALSSLGLAVWMAQSGLPLPCDPRTRIGWFDLVLTDIGDDQSLSRSLSTFSAHVTNLAQCLDLAAPGVLILLDEVAGGTDPDEGAALAEAILLGLVERGASVATTTHYERLKQLGARGDARFVNASVGFDLTMMRPTFTLTIGIPGASSALAVAARYGIPAPIVEAARDVMPRAQLEQQELLAQLERERQRLEAVRSEAESELIAQQKLNTQLSQEKQRAFAEERERLRRDASALTQEVKESRALLRKAQLTLDHSSGPRSRFELRAAEQSISEAAKPIAVGSPLQEAITVTPVIVPVDAERLKPGTVVRVPYLNATGRVLEPPSKGLVRVQVGAMKLAVKLSQLELDKPSKPAQQRINKPIAKTEIPPVRVAAARTSENLCDLRGVRVEAGLEQVEQFLDVMLQRGEPTAFILHGHGTGAMRKAVREQLATLGVVEHWEPAPREDGGDAITVAWLRG